MKRERECQDLVFHKPGILAEVLICTEKYDASTHFQFNARLEYCHFISVYVNEQRGS